MTVRQPRQPSIRLKQAERELRLEPMGRLVVVRLYEARGKNGDRFVEQEPLAALAIHLHEMKVPAEHFDVEGFVDSLDIPVMRQHILSEATEGHVVRFNAKHLARTMLEVEESGLAAARAHIQHSLPLDPVLRDIEPVPERHLINHHVRVDIVKEKPRAIPPAPDLAESVNLLPMPTQSSPQPASEAKRSHFHMGKG